MAQLQPCKICETEGVHSMSDWLITAQSEGGGFEPGFTVYVCQPCLAGLMLAWVQQQDADTVGAQEPAGPGVLEQVEQDEGRVTPAARKRNGAKSGEAQEEPVARSEEPEASTADVNG